MTDKTALRQLIEAVEAGSERISSYVPAEHEVLWPKFYLAMDGSLDAAKALHEALLPGWRKDLRFTEFADGSSSVCMFGPLPDSAGKWDFAPKFDDKGPNPARAWLIAILRAYEAQQ